MVDGKNNQKRLERQQNRTKRKKKEQIEKVTKEINKTHEAARDRHFLSSRPFFARPPEYLSSYVVLFVFCFSTGKAMLAINKGLQRSV